MDFSKIRLFLFDMDGTLYLGNNLFPFTKAMLDTIKAQGKTYLFMTNNSSKSVNDYVHDLASDYFGNGTTGNADVDGFINDELDEKVSAYVDDYV